MFNNKLLFLIIILILLIFLLKQKKESFTNNNRFKLVVTTFNPGKYLEKCLQSIERQKYKNYDVCVIDDASTKDKNYIHQIIFNYCKRNNWKYSFQKKNVGPLKSRINAINILKCKDDDILIFIDGDDMLSSSKVLNILNKYYQEDIYVTFGSFLMKTKNNIKKEKYIYCNENIIRKIKNKKVRNIDDEWYFSHLKTMKYYIYKNIDHERFLKHNGKYFTSATDVALMNPAVELANPKIKYIPEVLYYYTQDHPESFHNNKNNTQKTNRRIINSLQSAKSLFNK